MIEVFSFGIVLDLIFITLVGLFATAHLPHLSLILRISNLDIKF